MNAAITPIPRKERNARLNQGVAESGGIMPVGFSNWAVKMDRVPEPYGLCFLYHTGSITESHPFIDDFRFNNLLYRSQQS